MRVADALPGLALLALAACARLGGSRGDDGLERDVRVDGEPLASDQQARLLAHAQAGGLLYWRLPGETGPRCEAWRLVPDDDPAHGRLVLASPAELQAAAPADRPADLGSEQPAPSDSPSPHPEEPAPSDSPSPRPEEPAPSDSPSRSPQPAPSDSPSPALLALAPPPDPADSRPALDASPAHAPSPAASDIALPILRPDAGVPAASLPLGPRVGGRAPDPWAVLLIPAEPDRPVIAAEQDPSAMSLGPSIMRLGYRLADGHLTLAAPEHERPVAPVGAPPGAEKTVIRALTCIFRGASLAASTGPRRLVLAARDRFFFTADACQQAGFADDPPGDDEVRALGCAGALADLATRARLDRPPPAAAPDPAARLHRARAVHHLRRGPDGALVCDQWRHQPERAPGHGRLEHRGRDEHGAFVRGYAYDAGPGYLTLQGPTEQRRLRVSGRRTDLVQASSCIVTHRVTGLGADHIDLGGERWYLSKRACDAARAASAAAPVGHSPALVAPCQ